MRFKRYDIRKQIAPGKGEVLDDKVEGFVGILDAWDWDVADLLLPESILKKQRKPLTLSMI